MTGNLARVLSGLFVLVIPSIVTGQERAGLWGGLGGGGGWSNVSISDADDGGWETGGAGYFTIGWTLTDRLLIGTEFDLWSKTAESETRTKVTTNIYNFMGTLTWYPNVTYPFFVKGGAGASFLDADFDVEGTDVTVDLGTGFGLIVGAGYDRRVARLVSWTPAVHLWYGHRGDRDAGGSTVFTDSQQMVFDVTLGLTFH